MAKWTLPTSHEQDPIMNIYLLTRTERAPSYDVVRSMVVRAENETQARFLASQKAMDEGDYIWLDSNYSHIEEIEDGEAQVLCVDAVNG